MKCKINFNKQSPCDVTYKNWDVKLGPMRDDVHNCVVSDAVGCGPMQYFAIRYGI